MTDGFSGAESALSLSQSKAKHLRHSYSYGFRVLTPLSGIGDELCVLNVKSIKMPNAFPRHNQRRAPTPRVSSVMDIALSGFLSRFYLRIRDRK
jgi:hypothetical protein